MASDDTNSLPTALYWIRPKKRASFPASKDGAWQCLATSVGYQNKLQPMLPCIWLLIPELVANLATENNGDVREEDHAIHGSDKSRLILDFLLTLHGTLLVIVVGGGRNDSSWLCVHDDDDDDHHHHHHHHGIIILKAGQKCDNLS